MISNGNVKSLKPLTFNWLNLLFNQHLFESSVPHQHLNIVILHNVFFIFFYYKTQILYLPLLLLLFFWKLRLGWLMILFVAWVLILILWIMNKIQFLNITLCEGWRDWLVRLHINIKILAFIIDQIFFGYLCLIAII